MGKDERVQKIIDSWSGSNRLKEDTLQNVLLVLEHYGFSCEKKGEWVCSHSEFMKLAKNPMAKEFLRSKKLGVRGDFSFAVTHGAKKKAGMVIRCYLNDILRYIELLEDIRRSKWEE